MKGLKFELPSGSKEEVKKALFEMARSIQRRCDTGSQSKKKDKELWQMYNEVYDTGELDYLRKLGGYELPAKFRWIGVQRPRINLLASQQTKRPFPVSIKVGDEESKKTKKKNKLEYALKEIEGLIRERKIGYQIMIIDLQSKIQQLEELLQKEPETQEEYEMQAEISQQLPIIRTTVNTQLEILNKEIAVSEKDLKRIGQYLKLSYKELKELYAEILYQKGIEKIDFVQKGVEGFINKCTTGKEYYFVKKEEEDDGLPTFENIECGRVFYPRVGNIDWVQDGPWVAIIDSYSVEQLLHKWGDKYTDEERKKLEDSLEVDVDYPIGQTSKEGTLLSDTVYTGTSTGSDRNKMLRIYFKIASPVHVKKSPNKNREGKYFTKSIESAEIDKIKKEKGEIYIKRYTTKLYEAIYDYTFGKVLCVDEVKFVRRNIDNYQKIDLPVYGPSFSKISKQPYSLIKSTEELQKMINIFYYHRELMLATAGTKGSIVDKSQIPAGMSVEEHQYQKKTGNLYIQTVTKSGRKINSSFNQWQTYDESLTNSISLIDNMIMSTDNMIGYLMGVGPQRMGQVVQGDQVGKTEMAIQQNALITEILYYEHDKIMCKAIEGWLNLACKYSWGKGGLLTFNDPQHGEIEIEIPGNMWEDVDLEISIENNIEQESSLYSLKQIALQRAVNNMMPMSQYITMSRIKELKSLEIMFRTWEEEAMEYEQERQQSAVESQSQMEERRLQLEAQYQQMIDQSKNELEQIKLELENKKIEFEREKTQAELELKDKEIRTKATIDTYKADLEREVEMAYLQEQMNQHRKDESLREVTLKIDTMFKQIELQMAKSQQAYDGLLKQKEIKLKERQAKTVTKEKIKD
jgi:hypothetical protein